MEKVIGVRFAKTGKLYYMNPLEYDVKVGDKIVANSERGQEIGRVVAVKSIKEFNSLGYKENVEKIERVATKQDIENQKKLDEEAKDALQTCKKLSKKYKLDMKFIHAEYTLDKAKLICYFVAEERIDFREIVRELANQYRVRIELRQVGPRDEVKAFDNVGACGKEVCCRTFLPDFETVTIKMAKEQGLQINMQKLSGNCGRFKCCLKYEEEVYKEKLKNLPKVNEMVRYEGELCKVVSLDILNEKVRLKIGPQGEERFETVEVKNIKREKKKEEK